jgi:hypothetical protein
MSQAALICARLIREGSVRRAALPDLDLLEVRDEVEQRLRGVGLMLVFTVYSEYVGVRLSSEAAADPSFDAPSNVGLGDDHCALLAACWTCLAFPKRTWGASPEPPEGVRPFAHPLGWHPVPELPLEVLHRALRPALGGHSRIRSLTARLRQLNLLSRRGEVLLEGPALEMSVDGERMVDFIRGTVIPALLAEEERKAPGGGEKGSAAPLAGIEAQLVDVLRKRGGSAAMGELSRATDRPAVRLRKILKALEESGHVRRTGDRASARYHLVKPE